MNIYIYQEFEGAGVVFIKSATKPASAATITAVNGSSIPEDRQAYNLLETVTAINAAFNFKNCDYKTARDAMKSCVSDIGGGDIEAGFNLLNAAEQFIAASNNIGTGAQIAAAITNLDLRDEYSAEYLQRLKTDVRPARSRRLEAKTWSRCKQFNIQVLPGFFVTMPEVIYSQITINNPTAAGELGGNLLVYYEDAGILGFAGGDKSLGILDYLYSTAGTRYEGAGLVESFAGIVPDGYANIAAFRDALADIVLLGQLDNVTFA